MRFEPTKIPGVFAVRLEWRTDERGGFLRVYDAAALAAQGLKFAIAQTSISSTRAAGTVRGMHFQRAPHAETKLVRCLRGALFDVVVDLRAGSATRLQWEAFTLREGDDVLLLIPEGCAHGFQTLADDTDVLYQNLGAVRARVCRWRAVRRPGVRDPVAAPGDGGIGAGPGVEADGGTRRCAMMGAAPANVLRDPGRRGILPATIRKC